jgi:hypothetical protein
MNNWNPTSWPAIVKGDVEGHEFRGNQYTAGVESARSTVVAHGKETGNERVIVLDQHGGVVGDQKGHFFGATVSQEVEAKMKDPTNQLSVVHNHPAGRSLSGGDVRYLAEHPGVKSIEAVSHHGASFLAERGGKFNAKQMGEQYDRAYKNARESLLRDRDDGKVLQDDLEHMVDHATVESLGRSGKLLYSANLSGPMKDSVDKHPAEFEKAVRAAVKSAYFKKSEGNDHRRRSNKDHQRGVRQDGGVGLGAAPTTTNASSIIGQGHRSR